MKKQLLLLAVCMITVALHAQTRIALLEEFTGENCGPCAEANPGLWHMLLLPGNVDKMVSIKYMEPVPISGYLYVSDEADNYPRMFTYYNYLYHDIEFTPSVVMDGQFRDMGSLYPGDAAYLTQSDIDSEAAVPAPFNIDAVATYSTAHDSVWADITVTAVTNYNTTTGNLHLRTAFTRSMHFEYAPGDNGEKDFDNTVRRMYPSVDGMAITGTWAAGDVQHYHLAGALPVDYFIGNPVTFSDSMFAVWIQNDSNGRVEQAARATQTTAVQPLAKIAGDVRVYPNPASEVATLSFSLQTATPVTVELNDATGRIVKTYELQLNAGAQSMALAIDDVATGTYSVRVHAGGYDAAQPLEVVR